MVLVPLILLFLSLATSIHSLSAPECADGSTSVCKCGDGNPPDFSTFPPCDIKKVSIEARIYFTQPCSAGQAQVWVLRRWGPCFKVPQTKAKETLQSWQVQLLNLVKWTNVTLFTWRGPKFSKCRSPNVDRSPCTLHIAHCSGLPALTKPLLSVSNAPEEAAPPQRWDSRYPESGFQTGILLFCLSCLSPDLLQAIQNVLSTIFFRNIFCRQGAIQNILSTIFVQNIFLQAGSYPKCASGSLVCQDGAPLMCLVNGQITDTEAVFAWIFILLFFTFW